MRQRLKRHRTLIRVLYDWSCWVVAIVFATLLRFDLHVDLPSMGGILKVLPIILAAQLIAGLLVGMYRGRWQFGSFDEVLALVGGTLLTTALVFLVNLAIRPFAVPRSVPIGAGLTALVLMGGGRYIWRLHEERRKRPRSDSCRRLLVFGGGEGGAKIIRALLSNPDSDYLPVAILDDNPSKRNLRLMGVPVVGNRNRLATAAVDYRADALLIAIPSAGAPLVTELSEAAAAIDLPVKVLPPVADLLGGTVGVSDIRDVAPEDLLGRHAIRTDLVTIAGYLTAKRVMVTGAGGSIGAELCRQIYRFAPAELIMVDRDESALHAVHLSIHGRALMDSPDLVLLDLRDRYSVQRVFSARRPEVVFHAAALKHLPLLERHPAEAVRTNVWATLDLLEVAVAHGVERFVNVSTDKAADPCNVLGYSKRITERLTAYFAATTPTTCLSVRFGNVLGSRGSVLATFQAQVERGGPLTVTHPDVTRYFMTVEEAVELVVQAGAIGGPGEVLVLDMGEPVKIAEVAQVLAAKGGRRVTIHYTGLRCGEKLHEAVLGSDEEDHRPAHPLISHVPARALEPDDVRALDVRAPDWLLIAHLAELSARPTATEPARSEP